MPLLILEDNSGSLVQPHPVFADVNTPLSLAYGVRTSRKIVTHTHRHPAQN
ncbi:hypothetical protein [Nostoc sp. 'Peltigera malacea cyanobiont' DB3992]|uniref:hypothetical protein n=1 Tax=Nostoc sp. 'Peltigera malacea cyanobiont' DB3992 TaxID=1206980 RepID=UPI0015D48459|nr:hypothetical protein [Nostoc sp. 'Peltigera malacea cyanobiont' DB3992]